MSEENQPTGGPHKGKVKRGNRRSGESESAVHGVSSQEAFQLITILDGWTRAFGLKPDYQCEIYGKLISKKNKYGSAANGRRFKTAEITNCEKMVDLQIPDTLKGLELVSPNIILYLECPKFNADRDNEYTFLLDCLVKARVFKNDNKAQFNGHIYHPPAVRAEHYKASIWIWKNGK